MISSEAKEVASHFKRVHQVGFRIELLEKKFDMLTFATAESLFKYLHPVRELLEPVDGIEIKSGLRCLRCAYFCSLKKTMQAHLRLVHTDTAVDATFATCRVQSLYGGPKKKYFGVNDGNNELSSHPSDGQDAVDRVINDFTQSCHIAPTDDRLVSPFLRRMKWHEIVKTYCTDNVHEVITSITFDPCSSFVQLLFPVVCRYWQIGQEPIGTRDYLFERVLSSKVTDIEPASAIHRIQTSSTKYCKTMTSLLIIIDTHTNKRLLKLSEFENDDLTTHLKALVRSCSESFANTQFDDYRVSDVGVDQLELLDKVLEAIFRIDLEDAHYPSEFHAFVTHRFVLCSSICGPTKDSSGYVQFKQPGQITSLVAVIKYWARLAALMNLHQQSWGVNGSVRNSATRARAESLRYYLKTGLRTPFNFSKKSLALDPPLLWHLSSAASLILRGWDPYMILYLWKVTK
ncbi:unnamed protein product [Phytophthora fragariaefolia]|uniref:Unnamed protein product n=1 Tax=Phytophthora fragariaefolia TaxID=1490495 RepID=A0A9W7CWW5_9STRA|nr:unnamed protein product [Phytophthora fragariaefolia]